MKYTLESQIGDEWQFVAEFDDYVSADRELSGWQYINGRIRHGNQLIAHRIAVHSEVDELAEWRKRHVG